jgi:hypothetical protein
MVILTLADLGAQGDVLLGSADSSFLRGHGDGIWTTGLVVFEIAEVVPSAKRRSQPTLAVAGGGPAELTVRRSCSLCQDFALRLPVLLLPAADFSACVRALPLFLRDNTQNRVVRFFFCICLPILTPPSDPAHHRDTRLSFAQSAYAEREARYPSTWATQWWASSEWVIWARCTPGGSPTQDGGRCKVFPESACTVSLHIMVRSTSFNTPSPLHPDDLSAFGSSMAVWHRS